MLRSRLGDSQSRFAKKLGTTITTISRYENARIGIAEEMLMKMAELAKVAALTDLKNFFESQRNLAITARVESLPSAGAQRRVSLKDLQRWHGMAAVVEEKVSEAMESYAAIRCRPEDQQKLGATNYLLNAIKNNIVGELKKSIELYISTPTQKRKIT